MVADLGFEVLDADFINALITSQHMKTFNNFNSICQRVPHMVLNVFFCLDRES